MLSNSQRVRDELAGAVNRLDSYIELLRAELAKQDGGPRDEGKDSEAQGA